MAARLLVPLVMLTVTIAGCGSEEPTPAEVSACERTLHKAVDEAVSRQVSAVERATGEVLAAGTGSSDEVAEATGVRNTAQMRESKVGSVIRGACADRARDDDRIATCASASLPEVEAVVKEPSTTVAGSAARDDLTFAVVAYCANNRAEAAPVSDATFQRCAFNAQNPFVMAKGGCSEH